ncbi:ThuA domain-containing protein [Emticicia sp. 21SJ11W-3]|uniref:ThuA domain-containing protein n=1 Tax=Emticicia sp. 21SJ11W-3 TaxID=2916755 RepID=UPI0020A0E8B0|nr:ThuA domain-containing protein [Emticicia sp. 21SJ11W-3]UTA69650.1 ThuA domain-containing protein [Emticicia sp. 21SJ11W-3]
MKKQFNPILILLFLLVSASSFAQQKKVLVFSLTKGFHHNSIKEGNQFFLDLGKKEGIVVDTTTDATKFNEANLKNYNAVVFLSTTGDVLNPAQQADFERYIQAGGGYFGIHAASDTEYNWPWYNDLMGGYFASHPGGRVSNVQKGKMITLDKTFPASAHFPDTFEKTDEFYDFKSLKKDILKFIVRVDESSYQMGRMGDFHPMAWYHEFDGGKAFYSNFGHTPETFTKEPLIAEHFWQGLKWVMANKLDYSKARSVRAPEENRFERITLANNLNEPTELAVLPNGKVIFVERKGAVKVWNPATKKVKVAGQMPVYTKFEYGLMGVGADPDYEKNHWIYLYYTPDETREATKDNFLSRFVYDDKKDTVVMSSEKVVLRVFVKRDECCHTGGSIDWDGKGNLFLSTGDDTNPFASEGYAPIDFQPGREGWDALRSSGNTNDLRGKVLRIKPEDNGTYSIPEGNLYPVGTDKTRPEIYAMGMRNPYRIAVDKRNGYLYWGDVGPDAGKTNDKRGPEGIVEFNQARKPGFFGWPIFTGDNFAYNHYNFATKESGPKYDAAKPINDSPNNTGLKELMPATKAWMYYGYGPSRQYPEFGKGGCNPMAGPVYYSDDYTKNPKRFPSYFDGKFFAYEWMRDWIYLISMDKDGNYQGMERFMPNTRFYHPMDMAFSKDGRLFVLDYGMNWFAQNEEATLSVIEYNPGNRKPVITMAADKKAGAAPLAVAFSSTGTMDYDKDALKYAWNFGKGLPVSTQANPKFTFTKPGEYNVVLTVTDAAGNKSSQTTIVKVGNAEPTVNISIKGNKTFFFDNEKIAYDVKVTDKEDGTLSKGIDPEDVVVNINYLEGYDKTMLEQGHKENVNFAAGKRLIDLSDCKACHSVDKKSIGPAYIDVAKKYRRGQTAINQLAEKVIKGGGGVWGEQAMAAHPQLSISDARDMVDYILSLNDTRKTSQPVTGTYEGAAHKGKKEGAYIIQATYTDKGGKVIGPLTTSRSLALRSPKMKAVTYDDAKAVSKFAVEQLGGDVAVANENDSYLVFKGIDLTGIKTIVVGAISQKGTTVGGTLEVRLGSPTGTVVGTGEVQEASMAPVKVKVNTAGEQDIYFVFKNPKAEGKPLFAVNTIEFQN